MKKGVLFLLALVSCLAVRANNVQLQGTVKVVSATGSVAILEVDLSWENSWRDDYNWDATWLFFKYKAGVDGTWQHAAINTATATVTGGDYATMSASTGATAQGLFVYPSKDRGGNTGTLKVQVQWATSYTKAQFDNNDVFVVAHGIEMVYVPYGAYTIGDGSSTNTFTKQVIDSEVAWNGANANFPKGYQGFYVMKYETSQEQYIEFLNTLTLAQQTALIPGVDALSVGDFVFGANKKAPNHRNSIILSGKIAGKPLIFDNNLNNNRVYGEEGDGGTLAMNYISITDACGYASWAGLRPMTEMEYEKACRRPYPQEPDAGEYAWNSVTGAVDAAGLSMPGSGREIAATGNVNAGSLVGGPIRCGAFARSGAANQTVSGATYWGVMEMSGNVAELCATITNTTISKTGNGTGAYNAGLFGTGTTDFGTRGGGFSDTHTALATSSRVAVSRFTNMLQRDSTVGFRCVFSLSFEMDAGTVLCRNSLVTDTTCVGSYMLFKGISPEKGIGKVTYTWYKSEDSGKTWSIVGITGDENWTYNQFINKTTTFRLYKFKRKAVCLTGDSFSSELSVYVAPQPWSIPSELFVNPASTAQITTNWDNKFVGNWILQNTSVGVQISSTGMLFGITSDMVKIFTAKVNPNKCPEITYEKEIEIQRDFDYTGTPQLIALESGNYIIECWGAQGGKSCGGYNIGGYGGYAYGEIVILETTPIYVYVGSMGGTGSGSTGGAEGWNGGGKGGNGSSGWAGGGGGGGTDIRILEGDLYARIMVAGGGGGGRSDWGIGGTGGGIVGGEGVGAGIGGGGFGFGGVGGNQVGNQSGGGGGGGGYYGGEGGAGTGWSSGFGGSGFVSGMTGCDAIAGNGNLTSTGQPKHYSGVVFINPTMENGLRAGHGFARIRAK